MMKMSSSDRWSSASQSTTSELSSASTPPVGLEPTKLKLSPEVLQLLMKHGSTLTAGNALSWL